MKLSIPKTDRNYQLPHGLLASFVIILITTTVAQTGYFTYQTVDQYLKIPEADNSMLLALFWQFLPLAMFVSAYWLNPRKLNWLTRSFEALLIATIGVVLWSLYSVLEHSLLGGVFNLFDPANYGRYAVISNSAALVVFIIVLVWLRLSRRWR